ncbi:hypothetical protein [Natrinema altunense]|uniref:Uncharacterized protein n=1 Tax=Natrinema altunense (strain JCM 12890 / CGMCC 1.3731 / AJ2) TaxID=1227494 RepID=L9ZTD3_NATA2|nr:hypothetical protein [Natrinema altunense]ELY88438.1 hypothetical protein C485_05755 [Natrinema altunense JCM 12890]
MGHRSYVAVELAEGADPDPVVDALAGDDTRLSGADRYDDVLTFSGMEGPVSTLDRLLTTVDDALERAVLVINHDGGRGEMIGRYYENGADGFGAVEELRTDFRWEPGAYFDYFAAKYGIHAAV